MNHIARQIYKKMLSAKEILLVPHPNPDGDALGAVATCMIYLKSIGKPFQGWCATPVGSEYAYLPGVADITSDPAVWQTGRCDCIMVFDTGDLRHAGIAEHLGQMNQRPTIINMDHHATNEQFGDLNLVNVKASSTTQALYEFFRTNRLPVSRAMATCLLTGLMYDTDNFTNAATGEKSLTIASELLRAGADRSIIRRRLWQKKSVSALTLWGRALSKLSPLGDTPLIGTVVTLRDIAECGASEADSDGIANFLNLADAAEGRAMLVLKELANNRWRGSLRTTRDDTDVSGIAKALGGGGHKKAAGFTIEAASVEEAKRKILEAVQMSAIINPKSEIINQRE